ncbi:hypothetical protein ACFW2Y_08985 [Streptomyces sp. NPDC058877]|uniref:hypothetical protein n=1 Tax=Streptomyces sp. NPDC058877 TaxID=3346665 RepID=UPI0036A7CFA2
MSLVLVLLALSALAFLVYGVVLCTRVWRTAELPRWRRILPGLLLCLALAASLGRAWGVTAVAEAVAFPLNIAALLLASYEVQRHRRRGAAAGDGREAGA